MKNFKVTLINYSTLETFCKIIQATSKKRATERLYATCLFNGYVNFGDKVILKAEEIPE